MEENYEHISVGEGRENDPLHKLGESFNKLMDAHTKDHPDSTIVFFGFDDNGFIAGSHCNDVDDLVKVLVSAANHDQVMYEALKKLVIEMVSELIDDFND